MSIYYMRECKHCKNKFDLEPKIFANHVRWCEDRPDKENDIANITKGIKNRFDLKLGIKKDFNVECAKCGTGFIVNEREFQFPKKEKYFCGRSCANSRDWKNDKYKESNEQRNNSLSKTFKTLWLEDEDFIKRNTERLENSKIFTSKNEVIIRDYFKMNYPNDGWTFGGHLKFNDQSLVRDLYSNELKICIEYDGIWHFKDIYDQLEKKQLKDEALKNWCITNNWRLIRVDEEWFKYNKIDEIVNSVYYSKEQITLFGNRY